MYNAVAKGTPCTFGEATATDGRIAALKLTVLTDDKHYFPPYNLALTVREQALQQHPRIATVMEPVSRMLDTATLQQLNAEVDVEGKTPAKVASAWLEEHGLG